MTGSGGLRPGQEVLTSRGVARVHQVGPGADGGVLVLGHGAGGGVDAPELLAVAAAVASNGWRVALVEQPYRVAGRRAPAPAAHLDAVWVEVVTGLTGAGPLVVGGRSSGGRVAARTAADVGASAVVALAFPLVPPARPHLDRGAELRAAGVPTLVVQGSRDPFGSAEAVRRAAPEATVHEVVGGDHAFRPRQRGGRSWEQCCREAADVVAGFLDEVAER